MARPLAPIPLAEVERLAACGLSEADIAAALSIHPETLRRRKRDSDSLVAAIARGRARGTVRASEALARKIDEGDTRSILFFLRARAGWSESGGRPYTVHPYGADNERESVNALLGRHLGQFFRRHWPT